MLLLLLFTASAQSENFQLYSMPPFIASGHELRHHGEWSFFSPSLFHGLLETHEFLHKVWEGFILIYLASNVHVCLSKCLKNIRFLDLGSSYQSRNKIHRIRSAQSVNFQHLTATASKGRYSTGKVTLDVLLPVMGWKHDSWKCCRFHVNSNFLVVLDQKQSSSSTTLLV